MDKLEELIQKKQKIHSIEAGEELTVAQDANKMTGRERIEYILDEGSFIEIGTLVDEGMSSVITGYGTIEDRLVYICSYNHNINGGAIDSASSNKISNIMDMALKMGAPIIQIFDSIGGKLEEEGALFGAYGKLINYTSKLSGVVPQIAIVAGSCSGILGIIAAMNDFTIICEDKGNLYVNSPKAIMKNKTKYVDYNSYADSNHSLKNGSTQLSAKDDKEALDLAKKLVEYIPSNNVELPERSNIISEDEIMIKKLDDISKQEVRNVREIIDLLSDNKSMIEFHKDFSENVITALSKINGITVGMVATDCNLNKGYINKQSAEKITRFVKLCDSFNIPIISLVDTLGFEADIEEEKAGLALSIAKMTYALSEAVVPKIAVIIGKAYGAGFITLGSREAAFDLVYAWPNSSICISEPESLIKNLNRNKILTAENPKDMETRLIDEKYDEYTSPYNMAKKGYVDDIIIPSETKARIFMTIDMLQSKREIKYPKKHGSTLI